MFERFLLASATLVISASAFASFDLMVTPDIAGDGFRRYDPINRVGLGSIFVGGATGVAANSASDIGYYSTGAGLMAIRNSTGERVANTTFQSGFAAYNRAGSVIAFHTTNNVSLYNPLATGLFTSSVGFFNAPAGFTISGIAAGPANRWVVYGTSAGGTSFDLYSITNSGAVTSSKIGFMTGAAFDQSSLGQAAIVSRAGSSQETFVLPYRAFGGGASQLLTTNISAAGLIGTFSNQALSGYSIAVPSTTLAAVTGHTGFFVVGQESGSNNTRITEFDDSPTFIPVQSFVTSSIQVPQASKWRMSNVVAPEPASMIALGAGVLALIRRRKSSGSRA